VPVGASEHEANHAQDRHNPQRPGRGAAPANGRNQAETNPVEAKSKLRGGLSGVMAVMFVFKHVKKRKRN
jgi:hypothetical protein